MVRPPPSWSREFGNLDPSEKAWLREPMRRLDVRCLFDLSKEPLPELARRVLTIPIKRRREGRVVPVGLRGFFFLNCACVPTSGRSRASFSCSYARDRALLISHQ